MKSMNRLMSAVLSGAVLLSLLSAPVAALAQGKSKMVIQVSDNDPKNGTWQ